MKTEKYNGMFDRDPKGLDFETRLQDVENRVEGILEKIEVFDKILKAHERSLQEIHDILKENDYIKDAGMDR